MSDSPETVQRQPTKSPWDSKKFARLKSMDCFPEVYNLLVQGYAITRVSAMIQNQYSEYTDIRHESLTNMLRSYYEEEIPSAEKVAHQLPAKYDETVRDFEEQIDVMKEMTNLFLIQRDRIDMAWDKEQATEVLMKNTGREIKIAAELLDRIQKTQGANGMSPERLQMLHQSAGMALRASAITGTDGRPLMNAAKRNQIFEFLGMLSAADPRIVEAVVVDTQDDDPELGDP